MPERCTCGAQLPEDALFCHRCGKPQRELLPEVEPEPAVESVVAPPPIPVTPLATPIGFRNGQAVRIGLVAGVLSIFICALGGAIAPILAPLWMIVSGMAAVFIYKLRTGQRLSAIGGARIGWMSGIFAFLIVALLVAAVLNNPNALATLREQSVQAGRSSAELDMVISEFKQPSKILLTLPFSFLLFTVLSAFGGAIGARLLDRD